MLGLGHQQDIVIGLHDIHPLPRGNQIVLGNLRHFIRQKILVSQSTYTAFKIASQASNFLFWILASRLNAWKRMFVERPRPEKQHEKVNRMQFQYHKKNKSIPLLLFCCVQRNLLYTVTFQELCVLSSKAKTLILIVVNVNL